MFKQDELGIYIHIPFCKAKCHYCDFHSYAGREHMVKDYVRALKKEISLYSEKVKGGIVKTIFIGGGTPTSIDPEYIQEIMQACKEYFILDRNAEITIEGNPGTITHKKLEIYREEGINRLSMGLQSWQEHLLKRMGRIHTLHDFLNNFHMAKAAGFENMSVDLIFGLPDQTLENWKETLIGVTELGLQHISCYSLKIEEGTRFFSEYEAGLLTLPDEDDEREMYYLAQNMLAKRGFMQYEISNFAREGFISQHNMNYWICRPYIGLGAGAHSYFEDIRFHNLYGLEKYMDALQEGRLPVENDSLQFIDAEEARKEFMMLGLRLTKGVSKKSFEKKFGKSVEEVFGHEIENLKARGFAEDSGEHFRLTRLGTDLANEAFMEFV